MRGGNGKCGIVGFFAGVPEQIKKYAPHPSSAPPPTCAMVSKSVRPGLDYKPVPQYTFYTLLRII
jgi:hypothetical protein